VFGGFLSLYGALVFIAGSQLEKLRVALLDIRQTHVTAERDCGTQETQGQARASEELFRHMQKQLNNCIRHHQEIKRYV
jgi:glucose-6-phosphate-specific signal transduction histidine kinase